MKKKRLVSGKRSTGPMHLGHYLGALKTWISLQDKYDCFFFAADWHALTTDFKDSNLIQKTYLDNVTDWLALGLDPNKVTLFVQSHVKEHAELFLLLSMITPVGWLERNPTYKEQIEQIKNKDTSNFGFLGYPVLQIADILMYKGELVPVGEDQVSHLELGREITRRFNFLFAPIFPEPEAELSLSPKVPGTDGRKMSNSYNNCVYLSDNSKDFNQKILTFVTDPARKRRQDPGDPAKCPLFELHKAYSDGPTQDEAAAGCRTAKIGCIDCKKMLLTTLQPWHDIFLEKREKLLAQPKKVEEILKDGEHKARQIAERTIEEVRGAMKI